MASIFNESFLERLEEVESELKLVEKKLSDLYEYTGVKQENSALIDTETAASILGVCRRQFDRLVEKYYIEKLHTFLGPRFRRREVVEIKTCVLSNNLYELQWRSIQRRMDQLKAQRAAERKKKSQNSSK